MNDIIYKDKCQEILKDDFQNGYHYVIVTFGTHPCAYVELPKSHKYYGIDWMDVGDEIQTTVNWGLTYSREYLGNDNWCYKYGGWWIGWDYAHCDDFVMHSVISPYEPDMDGHKWTVDEIYEDVKACIEALIKVQNENEVDYGDYL